MPENWPFQGLEPHAYSCAVIDPPWTWKAYSDKGLGKSPQAHYRCMSQDEILALPVKDLAHRDGMWVILWGTAPMADLARDCFRAWGVTYSTQGSWAKMTKDGKGLAFGPGHVLRNCHEIYLIGRIGRPKVHCRSIRSVIMAPRRAHSQKPEEIYRDARLLAGPGRYADVFSRQTRPGWEAFGNEAGKFDALHVPGNVCQSNEREYFFLPLT